MTSQEYPPQLVPPPLRRMPNGAPEMPLRFNDRTVAFANSSICPCDMWPNFARSHSTILNGSGLSHGPPLLPPPPPVGGGAFGVLKDAVGDQSVVISPSVARTRQ